MATCLIPSGELAAATQSASPAVDAFTLTELEFPGGSRSTTRARVYVPKHTPPGHDWPVAILLHGYAQALETDRALAAWNAEYDVLSAYASLRSQEIPESAFMSPDRASQMNDLLGHSGFGGMVLITPVTPIPYFQRDPAYTFRKYAEWISDRLLPRVAELGPISTRPEHVGLCGFSMGGHVGLELLSRFPERFGAFCGVQIAIKKKDAYRYAWLLERAFKKKLAGDAPGRPIRVVTATRDKYRWSNVAFCRALERKHLDASLELRRGEHSSEWMKKAGCYESLLWLDQTLNGSFSALPSGSALPSAPSGDGES